MIYKWRYEKYHQVIADIIHGVNQTILKFSIGISNHFVTSLSSTNEDNEKMKKNGIFFKSDTFLVIDPM